MGEDDYGEYINNAPDVSGRQARELDALANRRIRPAVDHTAAYRRQLALAATKLSAQTHALMNALPQAPWLVRKKFGKSGKLYTLADIQQNVIRNNKAVTDAQTKAKAKESTRSAQIRRDQIAERNGWRGRPGIVAGTLTRRQGFDPGNPVAEALSQAWLGRILDADLARKRLSTASNRRGALATRSGQSTSGLTNRRGALAQRTIGPVVASTKPATKSATTSAVARNTRVELPARSDTVTKEAESAESKEARRVMGTSKSLPSSASSQRSATRSATPVLQRMALSLRAGTGASMFRTVPRIASLVPRSLSSRPALTIPQALALTPLNATGVGSQTMSQRCQCPTPKKKARTSSCTNPIVSRSVKDGIITTKRKLQCQPSRQK